jgi:hypothetical protein
MRWKNLGLPIQTLIVAAVVGLGAWLLSLAGNHYSNVPHEAARAQIGQWKKCEWRESGWRGLTRNCGPWQTRPTPREDDDDDDDDLQDEGR